MNGSRDPLADLYVRVSTDEQAIKVTRNAKPEEML